MAPPRPRSPRSLHAEYQLFIEQRIEEYKDSLPRADILAIGDEAVQELARSEQIALTEVVLREQVDAIIRRRLRLPSFRRWRERYLALREAQAAPNHWGLSSHDPVVVLAALIEEDDPLLIVGAADGATALYLAACRARVWVVDPDMVAIYMLEGRAVAEQLSGRLECEVATLATYTPDRHPFVACVIEAAAVADLPAAERTALITRLKDATPDAGRHVICPISAGRPAAATTVNLSSDALRTHYADWQVDLAPAASSGRRSRNVGFLATRPADAEGKSESE